MKKILTLKTFSNWASRLKPKHWFGLIFCLIILAYSAYQMYGITSGPKLVIKSPTPNSAVHSPLVEIAGQAKRISRIYLDDNQIFTDEKGQFQEKLLLAPGYTIIKLRVQDRFGRQAEERFGLVYLPTVPEPALAIKK